MRTDPLFKKGMVLKRSISILLYSLDNGGAERVVSVLLKELQREYKVTLFLMSDVIFYNISKDMEIVYLDNSIITENSIKKFIKLFLLARRFKKLNSSEISLSFLNRPNYINILAKLFGMKSKVIISERSMPSLQHKFGLQGIINRFLIRILYKHADIITANSKGNSNDLESNFNCKNVLTINNPLDINNIKELSQVKIKYRDEKFTFITIGRLDKGKNHTILIEAMKDLDAKLYIIGDGELRGDLQIQIERNNLQGKVVLLGKQYNPYMYLIQADCFVFSSLHEGFPNVLIEALACGLPIVSTDCKSGPREILAPNSDVKFTLINNIEEAEYGILIPINNLEKLKESMSLMINNKNNILNLYKLKAKQRSLDFNVKKIAKKFTGILSV